MMMKLLFFTLLTASSLFGGFFAESNDTTQKEASENERLCKLFTQKAETYKKSMRDDELAKATLASYEKRAALYCNRMTK